METFSKFIVDNWQFISTVLLAIFSLICMIIKRRPLSLDEFQSALDDCYRNLPYFIQRAENNISNGDDKLDFVLACACNHVTQSLHRPLTEKEELKVKKGCKTVVEEILFCPTRKGGFGREK